MSGASSGDGSDSDDDIWATTAGGKDRVGATLELVAQSVVFLDDPNIHLAAMNLLPTGDIPFSKVPEPAVDSVEAEELAVAG